MVIKLVKQNEEHMGRSKDGVVEDGYGYEDDDDLQSP